MTPALLAPEIDRLVWAVNDRAIGEEADAQFRADSGLSPSAFGTLNNLLPFVDDLTESVVARRYLYRPVATVQEFIAAMIDGGFLIREGDHLRSTERLLPITSELERALLDASRHYWAAHLGSVATASNAARRVLDTSPARDGLTRQAAAAPESQDACLRLYQRLAGLRLLRNESHVDAWRAHGLQPAEIEVLTDAWAGSSTQSPIITDSLRDKGLVDGTGVTEAGLVLRQQIEDATNDGVGDAFSVVDEEVLLSALIALPPELTR